MPCMQLLLSLYTVNPSFPHLVSQGHISAFGSYIRWEQDVITRSPDPLVHGKEFLSTECHKTRASN